MVKKIEGEPFVISQGQDDWAYMDAYAKTPHQQPNRIPESPLKTRRKPLRRGASVAASETFGRTGQRARSRTRRQHP